MTIDQNQTPVGEEEAHLAEHAQPEQASDTPEAATDAAAETTMPSTPAEPEAQEPAPELPASQPEEPAQPAVPADPVPAPPQPDPVTPAEPTQPTTPPATPEASAALEAPAAPAAQEESAPVQRDVQADADLFEAAMRGELGEEFTSPEGGYKRLSKGERIEATIVHVDKDKVFVDLGTKSEGVVPLSELSEENLETAKGHFNVGDKISVIVLRPESAEGNPIVSKKRADFEEIWDRIEEAHRTGETMNALVLDRVKGGLVVDIGVRGFVPATHVGSGKLRNIEKYVGQALGLKVIEIDRDRKKVVLSNRQAEEERKVAAKEAIFRDVKPGDILDGSVRRLTDYGAFVDLGGVDGLLHISEMSWARINHPKEMFKEGQKIKVMVLRLDGGTGKISLGHRQVLPDPWNLIKQNYTVGQKLTVTIGRIVQSGAFIKLAEGAEAFMPVSEMSYRRIKRPQDVVEENQEVEAQIIDLRPDERRMVLSMRALGGGGELRTGMPSAAPSYDDDRRGLGGPGAKDKKRGGKKGGRGGSQDYDDFEDIGRGRTFATSGATIGERLGMLKGFLTRDEDEDEETTEATDAVETTEADSAPAATAAAESAPEAEAAPAEEAPAEQTNTEEEKE
jgi:4-hydroxy-3-methylbut-2-enyl diphosphate reductase